MVSGYQTLATRDLPNGSKGSRPLLAISTLHMIGSPQRQA